MTKQSNHEAHIRQMWLHPHIIGLDGILLSSKESNLLDDEEQIIRQPDGLMFDPWTKKLYNIEYKGADSAHNYDHARHQLKHCERLLNNLFPDYTIINLYVSENYRVERV
jgi:hypothetical protein